jgi:hypothetical protein
MKTCKRPFGALCAGLVLVVAASLVSCGLFNDDEGGGGTRKTFWATDLTTAPNYKYYQVNAELLYEGAFCLIYADVKSSVSLTQARSIANEYDYNIHNKVTDSFGTIRDLDRNGKVTFLLLDIQDGYIPMTSPSYTGGYFYSMDMYSKSTYPHSNETDMLYLDTYPTNVGSESFFATMAHELQHLIEYSQTTAQSRAAKDTWINEGLSTAAEYLYGGDPSNRIADYVLDYYGSMRYGNNFFVWDGFWESPSAGARQDTVANYDTAYLFFQWLRIQASNGKGIYKDIMANNYGDYRDVFDAALSRFPADSVSYWPELMRDWLLSNYAYKRSNGIIGYGKDSGFVSLLDNGIAIAKRYAGWVGTVTLTSNKIFPGNGANAGSSLYPGAGLFSEGTIRTNVSANELNKGPHIGYAGITTDGNTEDFSAAYAGDILLTYNGNHDWERGGYESGWLAGSESGPLGSSISPLFTVQGGGFSETPRERPFPGPTDWKDIGK